MRISCPHGLQFLRTFRHNSPALHLRNSNIPSRTMSAPSAGRLAPARCWLHCIDVPSRHEPLEVPAAETIYLGRTRQTQIKDTFCARNQVSIDRDPTDPQQLTLCQVGMNPAALNGFALQPQRPYPVRHGDIIEVLHGKYLYEVRFEQPKAAASKPSAEAKRTATEPSKAVPPIEKAASLKRTRSAEKRQATSETDSSPAPATTKAFWESRSGGQLLVYTSAGVRPSARIAGYDLDGTLISTKSGNVFAKNADDWQMLFPEVPAALQKHSRGGHKIVIFTNQAGISTGRTSEAEWKRKLEAIVARIGVPVQCFAATGPTVFRKPRTGMWDMLREQLNGGQRIDRAASWYVGDAAGRPAANGRKRKDHSLADRLFALNVRLTFQTPEEHFQGRKVEPFDGPEFDPAAAMRLAAEGQKVFEPSGALEKLAAGGEQQVIVLVGMPGSGKSSVARLELEPKGVVVINQDTLKTWQKCVATLEATLQSKRSAAIDNTNVDAESRQRYVAVAKRLGVRVRCFVMATTFAQCKHNIAFRELTNPQHSKIPDRLLFAMRNKYKEPQLDEGFADIVRVNCVPRFQDKHQESVYSQYLVEK